MPLNMSFSFNYIFLVIMFWPIFFGMIGSQFVDVSLNCELWATFQFISILSILNNLLPLYQKFCNIIRFDEWCTCKNKCWSFPVFEFKKRQRVEDQMAWHVKWEFLCRRSPPLLSHVILTFHSFCFAVAIWQIILHYVIWWFLRGTISTFQISCNQFLR